MLLLLEAMLSKRGCVVALVALPGIVLPCAAWGQPRSLSQWAAGARHAGLGFLDGLCEVQQARLRGHLFFPPRISVVGILVQKIPE